MNSVERIRRAIKMERVDRLPLDFELFGETDVKYIWYKPPKTWKPKKYKPYYTDFDVFREISERDKYTKMEDEWGTIWGFGSIVGIIGEPLEFPIKDIMKVRNYQFPDPEADGRLDGLADDIKNADGRYINAVLQLTLFERLHCIFGFTETLINLIENPGEVEYLLDKILEFDVRLVKHFHRNFGSSIHGIVGTDDWGSQTATFIDPELWRKIFKPRYQVLSDVVHGCGYDLWFHSDGKIEEIMPDFIEVGVDVFQQPQPSSVLGIKEFGKRFAGKACHGLYIDIQSTAVYGTPEEIRQEARDLVEYWSNEYGSGVIAIDYQDPTSIGTTKENSKIALGAFKEAFAEKVARYEHEQGGGAGKKI